VIYFCALEGLRKIMRNLSQDSC